MLLGEPEWAGHDTVRDLIEPQAGTAAAAAAPASESDPRHPSSCTPTSLYIGDLVQDSQKINQLRSHMIVPHIKA